GNSLDVAGSRTFTPQCLARAAPEMRLPRFQGKLQGVPVHVGEHQYDAVARIGHDRGDQALFVEEGRKDVALAARHSEKPPEGERQSSMKRACITGLDLNSPVNWVVMVATLRLLTPRSDMH